MSQVLTSDLILKGDIYYYDMLPYTGISLEYFERKPDTHYVRNLFAGGDPIIRSNEPRIQSQKSWVNGKLDGESLFFHENGKISKKICFKNGLRNGTAFTHDEYGIISEEIVYENGVLNGLQKKYSRAGGGSNYLEVESVYNQGKKNGFMKMYYKGGEVKEECNFLFDNIDGERKEYYQNGQIKSISVYTNGILNGWHRTYFEDGRLCFECLYINGLESGTKIKYYENGQLEEESTYENGKKDGYEKRFSEYGCLIYQARYLQGLIVVDANNIIENHQYRTGSGFFGVSENQNPNLIYFEGVPYTGKVYEKSFEEQITVRNPDYTSKEYYLERYKEFKDGVLNGREYEQFENGQLYRECFYKNGVLHGEYKKYSYTENDGQIKFYLAYECSFNEGLKNGVEVHYHRGGNARLRCNYKNGKKHGSEIYYSSDGNIERETSYNDGKKDGVDRIYDESGNVCRETLFILDVQQNNLSRKEVENKLLSEIYKSGDIIGWKQDLPNYIERYLSKSELSQNASEEITKIIEHRIESEIRRLYDGHNFSQKDYERFKQAYYDCKVAKRSKIYFQPDVDSAVNHRYYMGYSKIDAQRIIKYLEVTEGKELYKPLKTVKFKIKIGEMIIFSDDEIREIISKLDESIVNSYAHFKLLQFQSLLKNDDLLPIGFLQAIGTHERYTASRSILRTYNQNSILVENIDFIVKPCPVCHYQCQNYDAEISCPECDGTGRIAYAPFELSGTATPLPPDPIEI